MSEKVVGIGMGRESRLGAQDEVTRRLEAAKRGTTEPASHGIVDRFGRPLQVGVLATIVAPLPVPGQIVKFEPVLDPRADAGTYLLVFQPQAVAMHVTRGAVEQIQAYGMLIAQPQPGEPEILTDPGLPTVPPLADPASDDQAHPSTEVIL